MSLANTLVASSVLATLAFTTASLTVSQLTLNSRLGNQKIARELAESAASDCLHQLMLDPDWKGDSHITLATAPGGWGRASFSPSVASQWGIPPSTNHLQGKLPGSSVADGSSLPASSLQLIAVGNYRGQRIRVVQMLLIPPFKYALSSSGAIVSNGGLTVGSVDDPALLANGFGSLPDDLIKAGHLAGNQSGPDSVHLNASPTRPVVIKGDVDSAGAVQKTDDAKVLGGIKENRQPVPLPSIPVHDYDPKDRSDLVKLEDPTQAHLVVKKPVRRQGALKITSGLEMTEGYLYVDGDLDIYGGISGKGAIFATGSIQVHGVSSFAANNQQAIVAGGDVSVEGQGRDRSTFQGVIYTEGNFHAKDITLVGALVGNKANDAEGDGSQMTLDACNLLYNRQVLNNVWSSGFDPGQEPSTLNLPDDHCPGSVGKPLPHAGVRIAADGEIEIRGGLFLGYLGGPQRTGEWLATGDLGHIDQNGFLHIHGRKKNLLITTFGRNVSPEWIETLLHAEPDILRAVVLGDNQPALGAVLWPAAEVSDAGLTAIVNKINASLPDYARIGRWLRARAAFSEHSGMATANGRPRRQQIADAHPQLFQDTHTQPASLAT